LYPQVQHLKIKI